MPTFYNRYRNRLPVVAIDGKSKRVRLSDLVKLAAEIETEVGADA